MTYTTVVENQTFNTQLSINTSDTWVRNCIFENIPTGNAVQVRGCSHVKISDCIIRYIGAGYGVLLSSLGSTDDVIVDNCLIHDTFWSGIHAAKREDTGITHTNAVFTNNIIHTNGGVDEHHHNIYNQAVNALIQGNLCYNTNGNNISTRVASVIRGNTCYGSKKASIRYYSDHDSDDYTTVLIENNIVWNGNNQADTSPLISLKDEPVAPDSYLADIFIIRFNTAWSQSTSRHCIKVEDAVFLGKDVQVYGNIAVNTADPSKLISSSYISYLSRNYTATTATNFINSSVSPYNLRLLSSHAAINYAIGEGNYPATDIDGNNRQASMLDAGAHQYSVVAPTTPAIYQAAKAKMLDEVANNPLKAVLLKNYAYSPTHAFLADISASYRVATTTLTGVTVINGTVDANNPVFTNVSGTLGQIASAIVFYVDLGSEATNRLYAHTDGLTIYLSPTLLTVTAAINENGIFTLGN